MPTLSDFELRTLPGLYRQYDQSARQMAFQAQSMAEAEAWQQTLRETITRLLCIHPEPCDLAPCQLESGQADGFTWELVVIQTQPGEYMPCYVLIPHHAAPPYRPVIALHGHGKLGARNLVGFARNPQEVEFIRSLNYDYARQLAVRGYLVFVPMLRGFAERLEDQDIEALSSEQQWVASCRILSVNALLLGKTLLGLRVGDVIRLIDYIQLRPEPHTDRLGCVGLSNGGMITLYTAALDQRISAAVVSGHLSTFRASIMAAEQCLCNYVPGLAQQVESADVGGLIAPRPLLIEAGIHDLVSPLEGTQKAIADLRRVYSCFGAADRLAADVFDGGHQWHGEQAYPWLDKWLS